jgi:hypothetical protein
MMVQEQLIVGGADPSLEPQTWSETLHDLEQVKKMDKKELRRQDMIYELIQVIKDDNSLHDKIVWLIDAATLF